MRSGMCIGALTAILLGSSAQGAILEEFAAEDWSGLALSDDQTGRLASCAIYSRYQNGATLFFIKHVEGGWALSLVHGSWALTENAQYPVHYKVDRGPFVEDIATALGTDQIGITLADNDPLIAQVRRGSLLNIRFEGREYGFELSNSGKALEAATDCLDRGPEIAAGEIGGDAIENSEAAGQEDMHDSILDQEGGAVAITGPADRAKQEAISFPERRVGSWVVRATRDEAGHFLNCTAFSVQGQDQLILSHYPNDLWDFGVYRGSWSLDAERIYLLWFNVDGPPDAGSAIARQVEVLDPARISFEAAADDIERLASGRVLNLQLQGASLEGQILQFPLAEAAEAFAASRECTRRHAQGT